MWTKTPQFGRQRKGRAQHRAAEQDMRMPLGRGQAQNKM
jgi:hypothetical protein